MREGHSLEDNFTNHKPSMNVARTVDEVVIFPDTIAQVKVDGEGQVLVFSKGHAVIINRSGVVRSDMPATQEVENILNGRVQSAKILCELHTWDWKRHKPGNLTSLRHAVSSKEVERLRLGIFDLLELNGRAVSKPYPGRLRDLAVLFMSHHYRSPYFAYILPNTYPLSNQHLKEFWDKFVDGIGYEGLVVRSVLGTYKVKPVADIDVVIIGLKKTKTFLQHNRVQTVRVALMDGMDYKEDADRFVVLGDVSGGIDHDLGRSLYELTKFAIGEDSEVVYIQPLVVAKVEYTDLYRNAEKVVLRYAAGGYRIDGWTNLVSLREPRLVAIRPDKRVTPEEVGLNQIPPP